MSSQICSYRQQYINLFLLIALTLERTLKANKYIYIKVDNRSVEKKKKNKKKKKKKKKNKITFELNYRRGKVKNKVKIVETFIYEKEESAQFSLCVCLSNQPLKEKIVDNKNKVKFNISFINSQMYYNI